MSREKARDQDRFEERRRRRLEALGVRSVRDDEESPRIEYLAREIVTVARDAGLVGEELGRLGNTWTPHDPGRADDPNAPVVIELDGDAEQMSRQVNVDRTGRGESELEVAPHHVLSIARTKIGPGSDPWPALPGERAPAGPALPATAPVIGVVDTGRWDPMPATVALADPGGALDLDPVDDDQPPLVVDYPGAGHGGFIAGVVNHRAPGVAVVNRRGYRPGTELITEESVVLAGDAAVAAGARILNLSLGTYAGRVIFLRDAVKRWVAQGCLVVAAAGNDALSLPFYPAGFAADPELACGVVSVGALETRRGDGPAVHSAAAPFSNRGWWVTAWAPGADVVSDYPAGMRFEYDDNDLSDPFASGLAHWDGTSFAAPFVAAEIARHAAANGFGGDVQEAWADLRGDSPFVVFWPDQDEDAGDDRGRYSRRPRTPNQ